MKRRLRIIIPIVIALAAAAAFTRPMWRGRANANPLTLSGNIEVTDARLSFRIAGRLAERRVSEGDQVTSGQVIARLDDTDQRQAVARARAALSVSLAALAELEAGSRREDIEQARALAEQAREVLRALEQGSRPEEIQEAEAAYGQAQAAEARALAEQAQAGADEARYREMSESGAIGQRDYELFRTRLETARAASEEARAAVRSAGERLALRRLGPREEEVAQARAAYAQAVARYELAKAGPRAETITHARAQADVAREGLRQAEQQLEYTILRAPHGGMALSHSAELGEYLNPGSPVITLADLDDVWLRAYVGERDLGRIKLGQACSVRTDTHPDQRYPGRVGFIASEAEFTPKSIQTFDERVKLMYRVKIYLDNSRRELNPGMPADAIFDQDE